MKLPNAHLALAEREKILECLLNPNHPDNGGKAAFFVAQGFRRSGWRELAAAFRRLARTSEVTSRATSRHGEK